MDEYLIHTEAPKPKDSEAIKHRVLDAIIPLVLVATLVCAFGSSPKSEKKGNRWSKQGYPRPELISINTEKPRMNVDQFGEFSEVVQDLLADGWRVGEVGIDGTVVINIEGGKLQCGALDPTPEKITDNKYFQYSDVNDLVEAMGVEPPSQTILIWENKIGLLPGSHGGAGKVDTKSVVWACPTVANVE